MVSLGSHVIPALQELLSAGQSDARWWAARTLAEIHETGIHFLLIKALHDPEKSVRECAAIGLRQQPDPAAIPDLIECIQGDDSELVRLASDALVSIGAQAALPLIDVLKNGRQGARLVAIRALARIGDTRSIPALFEALSQDSSLLKYWSNEGLEKMGVGMTFFKT